ncbi:Hsp20/alpha crystallin family protein [Acidobacteriota bacterium]
MAKKIKPVTRAVKLEAEINRIVDKAFSQKRETIGLDESWIPCVDISESEDEITVEVELPGIVQKDISILLHSNRIEIKGIKRETLPQEKVKYLQLEREYGVFRRLIFLPGAVMTGGARASIERGILTIAMKKYKRKRKKEVILKIQKHKE